jgi:hypothetical protein
MLQLDHLIVSGSDLPSARSFCEGALQVEMTTGGAHPIFQTHNAVMGLQDQVYLEAISANPDVDAPSRPRWYDLDRFEGAPRLTHWACRTENLEDAVAQFPEAGDIISLSRGAYSWRMAVPRSGILPFDNLFPALLQWEGDTMPQHDLAGTASLEQLIVTHPWSSALEALVSPFLSDARVSFREGAAGLAAQIRVDGTVRTL